MKIILMFWKFLEKEKKDGAKNPKIKRWLCSEGTDGFSLIHVHVLMKCKNFELIPIKFRFLYMNFLNSQKLGQGQWTIVQDISLNIEFSIFIRFYTCFYVIYKVWVDSDHYNFTPACHSLTLFNFIKLLLLFYFSSNSFSLSSSLLHLLSFYYYNCCCCCYCYCYCCCY